MQLSVYLKDKSLTAAEFGRAINMSRSAVTRLCNGERTPSLEVIRLIADATKNKVTASDFIAAAEAREKVEKRAASGQAA